MCWVGMLTIITDTESITILDSSFVAFKFGDNLCPLRYLQFVFKLLMESTTFLSRAQTKTEFPRAIKEEEWSMVSDSYSYTYYILLAK